MPQGILQALLSTLLGLVVGLALFAMGGVALNSLNGSAEAGAVGLSVALRLGVSVFSLFIGALIAAFLAPKHPRFSHAMRKSPGWVAGGVLTLAALAYRDVAPMPVWALAAIVLGGAASTMFAQFLGVRLSRRGRAANGYQA